MPCWSLFPRYARKGRSRSCSSRTTLGWCANTPSKSSGFTRAKCYTVLLTNCSRPAGWPKFLKWGLADMEALRQILSPDFLLRNSVYTSVLVGFACPLVGVFLVMRRLVFMGVALPQISSTGVAIALSLPLWFGFNLAAHGTHSAHELAFFGSITFSLTAILVLAFMERRGSGQPEGRLGTAYVVAAALGILLLSQNPYGEIGWLDMMKGEVIAIHDSDLILTAATLSLVLATLGLFHKELLLVSFDREMASILGKNVVFWDVLLYLLIGLTVSMAVLSVGPLIAFGFLLIPALT